MSLMEHSDTIFESFKVHKDGVWALNFPSLSLCQWNTRTCTRTSGAAWQRFPAGLATGGDGVAAAVSLWVAQLQQLAEGGLATGAGAH